MVYGIYILHETSYLLIRDLAISKDDSLLLQLLHARTFYSSPCLLINMLCALRENDGVSITSTLSLQKPVFLLGLIHFGELIFQYLEYYYCICIKVVFSQSFICDRVLAKKNIMYLCMDPKLTCQIDMMTSKKKTVKSSRPELLTWHAFFNQIIN